MKYDDDNMINIKTYTRTQLIAYGMIPKLDGLRRETIDRYAFAGKVHF